MKFTSSSTLFLCMASLILLAGCATSIDTTPASPVVFTPSPSHSTPTPSLAPTQTATISFSSNATEPAAAILSSSATTQTAVPTRAPCLSQPGRMEESTQRSSLLKLPMEYRVFLPPCYDLEPERRYPVLYLIHGQNFNHDQWDRLGADDTAFRLISSGEIHPFILILPRDRSWAQPDEDMFGQVLVESLIPTIDERYRTLPERSFRAIGGLSRGAAWAVHLGLSQWELFGAIGAHSLPVFWADTPHIRKWLDSIPPDSLPRIFMDTGEKDYLIKSTLWFEGLLTEKSIPHEWYLFTGYHEEAYWESHVEQYLRWYAQEW